MPNPFPTTAPSGAVTIRGLAPELKARLRVRAAHNARSMEAEARAILEMALATPEEDPTDLATYARSLLAQIGGVDLELPPREPARDPPDFEAVKATAEPASAEAATRKTAMPKSRARATPGSSAARRRR